MFKQTHGGDLREQPKKIRTELQRLLRLLKEGITTSLCGQRIGVNINFTKHWEKSDGHQRLFLCNLRSNHRSEMFTKKVYSLIGHRKYTLLSDKSRNWSSGSGELDPCSCSSSLTQRENENDRPHTIISQHMRYRKKKNSDKTCQTPNADLLTSEILLKASSFSASGAVWAGVKRQIWLNHIYLKRCWGNSCMRIQC